MSGRTVVRRNSGSVWKQCPPGHQVMLLRRLLAPRAHAVGGDDGVVGALQREQRAGHQVQAARAQMALGARPAAWRLDRLLGRGAWPSSRR
ncbi:MAG: hypothetical protein ACXVII_23590 [Solirubrobacteraceae bacterium]